MKEKNVTGGKLKKVILVGVCGILAVSSIFMTIETATSGVEVSNLQKEEAQLLGRKRSLEDTLVQSLSISELEEKSGEMGYTKPVTLVYPAPLQPVAKLP
jgi:hypothetical protein